MIYAVAGKNIIRNYFYAVKAQRRGDGGDDGMISFLHPKRFTIPFGVSLLVITIHNNLHILYNTYT